MRTEGFWKETYATSSVAIQNLYQCEQDICTARSVILAILHDLLMWIVPVKYMSDKKYLTLLENQGVCMLGNAVVMVELSGYSQKYGGT